MRCAAPRASLADVTTQLDGQVVLVAGASGALGSRVARGLANAGATVVLQGRDRSRLDAVGLGPEHTRTTGDLRDPATPGDAVQAALDGHGRLDATVYAAGVVAFGRFDDLDDDVLDELLLLNTMAPIRLARAAVPHLPEGGALVNVSAVVAEHPTAGMAAYSASKAALTAFDAAATTELRRRRIRVLDVRPPHTETGLADRPVAGTAPRLPEGKDPDAVAARVVRAIAEDERDLPSSEF